MTDSNLHPVFKEIFEEQDWEMFKVFAKLHPVEAYDSRPDDFCKFMRDKRYNLNNEQIKELVDSSRLNINKWTHK
jgi:hypothetical protein